MKRWTVLLAGVMLQTILGGVYAWSAFVPSLTAEYGLTNGQCGLIFGVTIAMFTVAMIPAGRFLHVVGPRMMAGTGAAMFAAGYLLASVSGGRFAFLLAAIGGLTGVGIGAGYVCPLTVAMKWFPKNRGLVTGVAVAGFGGGAVLVSVIVEYMLETAGWNVLDIFRLVGIVFGSIALAAGSLLSEPPPEAGDVGGQTKASTSVKACLLTGTFALLCVGMFAGTVAGLLTVGNLKPIMLRYGFGGTTATLAISIFALGNAAGRIIWGQIHDRLKSRLTILWSLGTLAVALLLFLFGLPVGLTLGAVALGGIGFGGCFVVYASSMVEFFGVALFPRLYPLCFLGYGIAGLAGPGIGGWIADRTGSFDIAIGLSVTIVVAAGVILALGLKHPEGEKAA